MKHFYTFFAVILVAAFAAPVVSLALVSYPPGSLLQVNDVTSSHIRNGTVVDADVSNTAAISATKVAGGSNSGLVMLSTAGGLATSSNLSFSTSTSIFAITGRLSVTATTTFNTVGYKWPSADGSSSQVLQTNGAGQLSWVDSGRTLLYATTTDVSISSTAATTTLISFSVPANTLSTGNVIKGRINFVGGSYGFSLLAANTATVKVLYGGTEIGVVSVSPAANFENGPIGNFAAVDFVVAAKGATNSQEGYVTLAAERNDTQIALRGTAVGTAAVDSTSAQTLSVVLKYSAASVNNSTNMANAYVEIVR